MEQQNNIFSIRHFILLPRIIVTLLTFSKDHLVVRLLVEAKFITLGVQKIYEEVCKMYQSKM